MHCSKLPLLPSVLALPLLDSILDLITSSVWTTLGGRVQKSLGSLTGTIDAGQVYDIVVVGGGTTGNTIAYRLAEASYTVAVVEAGRLYELSKPVVDPAPLNGIIGVGSNPVDSISTVDFGLKTIPRAGAGGRRIHYAQGKWLGGSSALNFMVHHRPNRGALIARAEAVEYTITANREIVLSAGAVHSPQLLMLSEIGPAEHLGKHGIEALADRPGVGQDMSDHALFGPTYEVTFDTLNKVIGDPTVLMNAAADYKLTQTGLLTNNVAEFLAWKRMPSSPNLSQATWDQLLAFPEDWPHIEYSLPPARSPRDGKMYAAIIASLAAPLSRDNVSLASGSPTDQPLVNPNWLTHPGDFEVAVAMYKRIREIFNTEAVRSIRASGLEYWPGPNVETDAQILTNIRTSVMSVLHVSCTARMGRRDDPTAVTDSSARVIGVEKLRVVDASSLALLPPGHPQALIYALAEKIADDIIQGLRTSFV
ncbi:choline dehydrogenase [Colletotrichum incanum]|nr:choline dehydrogenase [Colletotrichum incanum]